LTIQHLSAADFTTLHNPGVRSVQIVWPNNAPDARVTISRVTMEPGAASARHVHPASEQIWLIEQGSALLLMDCGRAMSCARLQARSTASPTRAASDSYISP
jgi:quercetin dioxygenase-like cupin family protein